MTSSPILVPVGCKVALATTPSAVDEDTDLPILISALASAGVDARAVHWEHESCDWSTFGAVVVISTCNYCERYSEYLAWIDGVDRVTMLLNPRDIIHWNSDKRYLSDLALRGVPIVPTDYVSPGESFQPPGSSDFVVKPAISVGARDTARYRPDQLIPSAKHVNSLHAQGRTAMIQPYLPRIAEGERALVFIDGSYSHAVWKGPVLTDVGVVNNSRIAHPDVRPYDTTAEELALGRSALQAVTGTDKLLFARVDMALDERGSPLVMELELIEPNLFLAGSRTGVSRFSQALRNRLQKGSRER